MRRIILILVLFVGVLGVGIAQHDHDHSGHDHDHHGHTHAAQNEKAGDPHHEAGDHGHHDGHANAKYDPSGTAFHHIADANVFSIGPWSIPLPAILYAPDQGWSFFSSGKLGPFDSHGNGSKAYKGYVLYESNIQHVPDPSFPQNVMDIDGFSHKTVTTENGKQVEVPQVVVNGKTYDLDSKSTFDGGLLGGGITSFYDFSITKNVATMAIVFLILAFVFIRAARAYQERDGQAPKGIQSFLEPMFIFIQDEVAKPFIGPKWEKYISFLQALFFFILGLNLIGQIPFFGNANVTGNLAFTMVLAIITFFVVNLSGNRHYWEHVLWMPGIPAWVKVVVSPVEILGLFIKPFTLMLRLFANITAGHIVVLSFVGLIFIFGDKGVEWGIGNTGGSLIGLVLATVLTLFMMAIELLVAFVQAFVFTILTASYIGAAVEEGHHHDEDHDHVHTDGWVPATEEKH